MLLLSGVKGKVMRAQQKNVLRKANAVPTLPHGVGLFLLKLSENFLRNVRKDKLFSLLSVRE